LFLNATRPPGSASQALLTQSLIINYQSSIKDSWALGETSLAFKQQHFPDVPLSDWCDWRWQLRHRLQTADDLAGVIALTDAEYQALTQPGRAFPVSVTPYYASLLSADDPCHPLRRTVIPTPAEFETHPGDMIDPLAEDDHSPVPGIVHRYPDRALFLVTDYCPVYCRYCTRSRLVGGNAPFSFSKTQWQRGIDYIADTPAIRDVLVSGGDPLVYSDDQLTWLLQRLRAIPHLEMIRIGSKIPMVLPQRVTPELCSMLKRLHPLYMSVHITHPAELTEEAAQACTRLADAGIPLGSQTVLLQGVNDDADTMRTLMHGLLKIRVRPYYLLQCDPIQGSAHLRTPVAKGIEIIKALRGHTTGYAVPHYIVDVPGGGGKISLDPEYITGRDEQGLVITNFQGMEGFHYPDL
jgi:lysine 2,3-aminomutase